MDAVMNFAMMFIDEFVTLFAEMAPFLLLGFLLAGVIHVWIPNHLYIPKISKPTFMSVLWAALFGVPLPICSCGVIPTSIAIRREGASKGASVSFLISTPATGVDSILATYSLLGLPFAILRPIAAFATALFGGVLTNAVTRGECTEKGKTVDAKVANSLKVADGGCCGDVSSECLGGAEGKSCENAEENRRGIEEEKCGCGEAAANAAEKCGCAEHALAAKLSVSHRVKETLRYGFVDMVSNVSKWLCIGLVLGALIAAFVPNDFFLALREYPLLCMLAVLVLAMPMYTCATGSIPLALALVAKGITPGAALVLLMAGPATSIASMLVVGKAFGKRTLAAYLISIAGGALFFGFIVDTFFMDTFLAAMLSGGSSGAESHGHAALGIFDYASAALLALLMIYSRLPFDAQKSHHCECGCEHGECGEEHCGCSEHDHAGACDANLKTGEVALTHTYRVLGMNCSHCKMCVEKAAMKLDGVTFATADIAKKQLEIEGSVEEAELKAAIEAAGFEFGGKA